LRKRIKMPDLTELSMTKAEIKIEAIQIHNKNVEEIKNTLPPQVSAVFLEAYDNFINKCGEDTENDELFPEHFATFMEIITKKKTDIMKEWNETRNTSRAD